MPSESLYLYEHDLYAAHLFIITRWNTDSSLTAALKWSLIISHFPFGTALFCGIVVEFIRFGEMLIGDIF